MGPANTTCATERREVAFAGNRLLDTEPAPRRRTVTAFGRDVGSDRCRNHRPNHFAAIRTTPNNGRQRTGRTFDDITAVFAPKCRSGTERGKECKRPCTSLLWGRTAVIDREPASRFLECRVQRGGVEPASQCRDEPRKHRFVRSRKLRLRAIGDRIEQWRLPRTLGMSNAAASYQAIALQYGEL